MSLRPRERRHDPTSTFEADVTSHRSGLLRIARLQLRDDDLAEDVVQETLIAALRSRTSFTGGSTLKTWLVGILKHKIIDALRRLAREPVPVSSLDDELRTDDLNALFDEHGIWRAKPQSWEDPFDSAVQVDFLRVLEECVENLPANTARVFLMRELVGLDTQEICAVVSISSNHLAVLLYRARMSLRRCLDLHWHHAAGETR